MKKSTAEWLKSAELDIESIRLLKRVEKLTPIVSFHAQQAVEKSLKALLEEFIGRVPKEHSIIKLYKRVNEIVKIDIDYDILTDFDQIYIETRYPGESGLLPDGTPSLEEAAFYSDFAVSFYNKVLEILKATKPPC